MTFNINKYWSVTVSHAEKVSPKNWQGTAHIFRRDNQQAIDVRIIGKGTTMNSADDNALMLAKNHIETLGIPKDWNSK